MATQPGQVVCGADVCQGDLSLEVGELCVGCAHGGGAPCIAEFLPTHPRVDVQLETGLTTSHLEQLRSGRLDTRAVPVRLRVPHIQTLKELVLLGAGAAILPDYTVPEPEFARRPIEGLTFSHPVWAALRPSSRGIAAVRVFLARLMQASPRRLDARRPRVSSR